MADACICEQRCDAILGSIRNEMDRTTNRFLDGSVYVVLRHRSETRTIRKPSPIKNPIWQ